jgi:hypothetical protein
MSQLLFRLNFEAISSFPCLNINNVPKFSLLVVWWFDLFGFFSSCKTCQYFCEQGSNVKALKISFWWKGTPKGLLDMQKYEHMWFSSIIRVQNFAFLYQISHVFRKLDSNEMNGGSKRDKVCQKSSPKKINFKTNFFSTFTFKKI